jgi:hypothetical protein
MINFDRISAIDTEDDSKGHFTLGVHYDGRMYKVFRTRAEMRTFLCSHYCRNRIIFAHNCLYDLLNIFEATELELFLNNGKLIRARRRSGSNNTVFLDSMNYIPTSLAKVGDVLGLPKLDPKTAGIETYCKRDTEIVFLWVIRFLKFMESEFNMKRVAFTLTGFSWKVFKAMYPYPVKCRSYEEEARASYFGGRVEIFRLGKYKGLVYENDVNSMYPSVMYDSHLPYIDPVKSRTPCFSREGVSRIFVESDLKVPLFAKRMDDGKLLFPNGRFWTTATNVEIRYFESLGGKILKTDYSITTPTTFNKIFNPYVDRFYELKRTAKNSLEKTIAKLFLNGLYGKFAIRGEGEYLIELLPDQEWTGPVLFGKGGIMAFQKRAFETEYMNVFIGSYITALSRMKLHRLLMTHYDKTLYCDTDSLITTEPVVQKTDVMGELSLKSIHKDGNFVLPKLYQMGDLVKSKGLRLKTKNDFDEFLRTGHATIEKPIKLKESIRSGEKVNVWVKREKYMRATYTKRHVLEGGRTTALILNEGRGK